MKFSTQLTTLALASSVVAQQNNNGNIDINNFINSAVSALNNVLPTAQVQSIVTAVSNGIAQNQPTGVPRVPTTINNSQVTQSGNTVIATATDSASDNGSATPTDNSSPTPTDNSASTTDISDNISSSASILSSSISSFASAQSSSSSSSQSSGSQINAPAKYTYVVAGAAFALVGNYLI
ncbi:hypothetical protein CONCODRAFT_87760 [Conidiobolus coronatus NRRL 28638]|uniref:Uncharacterized protein n=1 Tax=Conidiobolus coronatus (strain ATCC 28846 / CBS 209.66 / NRRL 28638) TaxID=796925 RepID=A0A137NSB8_CONC2|nr:hypothetical protein CONCODRAFT_87760 [Conidiobolus coronatus NRRL 28638]|eukprot:KXN65663.1 hypothetical protein CONCODRAFT_87760 [Conidiobolus coronatus NRRL 28638]